MNRIAPYDKRFGRGQGGEVGGASRTAHSPQRAVTAEPTPARGKRPAARRGFGEKAGWLRCSSVGDRDYDIKGAKCQLIVTPDLIVLKSPGRPVKPITVEQLQSFGAPMVSRNPMLHVVFSRMEMAEERGLGLKSMRDRATELGLPLPKYGWEEPYLTLTLYRNAESATKSLDSSILDQLSSEEQKGWTFLSARSGTTQSEYARNMEVTARTAQRHLSHFVKLGLLRRVGRGPATEYLKPEYLKP